MSDTQRPYHDQRLNEIRSKFSNSAPNFGLEAVDVHFLLSMASAPFTPEKDAEIAQLTEQVAYEHREYESALFNWQAHIETDKALNAEIARLRGVIQQAFDEIDQWRSISVTEEKVREILRTALGEKP